MGNFFECEFMVSDLVNIIMFKLYRVSQISHNWYMQMILIRFLQCYQSAFTFNHIFLQMGMQIHLPILLFVFTKSHVFNRIMPELKSELVMSKWRLTLQCFAGFWRDPLNCKWIYFICKAIVNLQWFRHIWTNLQGAEPARCRFAISFELR